MTVLPWPGAKAWAAPTRNAMPSIPASTHGVTPLLAMRSAKRPPARAGAAVGWLSGSAATTAVPGVNRNVVRRRFSGDWIRSPGYERSSSVRSRVGASDARTRPSPLAVTTISRQPTRSGSLSSANRTVWATSPAGSGTR